MQQRPENERKAVCEERAAVGHGVAAAAQR
jgi:hypothetical protein